MHTSRAGIAVFVVLLLFTCFLIVELFWAFVTPIVLALVLISIFHPVYKRILALFRGHKHLAAGLVVVLIILCVTLPLSFFLASLSQQALQLYESSKSQNLFNGFLSNFSTGHPLVAKIHGMASGMGLDLSADRVVQSISQAVSAFGHMLYENLTAIASNALSIVFNFVITMLLVYTLLATGEDLRQYLMDLSPLPNDEKERLVSQFSEISRAVFVSNGVVSVTEGVLGGLGFYWFSLGPGLFWGVVVALSAFLPVVGAWAVIGPAAFILFMEGRTTEALVYLLYNAVYFVILEFFIRPRLIGGKNQLNTILVLLSVLGGIKLFGVLGIFYGPLVVTMFMSLIEIYKEHYREHLLRHRLDPNSEVGP